MHSITTSVTPQQRSQSASASTSLLVVPKLRVSWARRLGFASDGTRMHASRAALPISIPHTRSKYSGSSVTSSTPSISLATPKLGVPPGDPRANGRS